MSKGWRKVHAAKGQLVISGVYVYVRHPQFTGLFLMILGFLIQWPTFLTVLMAPVLVYAYLRLSRSEEQTMIQIFGDVYRRYAADTPMFFPSRGRWKAFLWTPASE